MSARARSSPERTGEHEHGGDVVEMVSVQIGIPFRADTPGPQRTALMTFAAL